MNTKFWKQAFDAEREYGAELRSGALVGMPRSRARGFRAEKIRVIAGAPNIPEVNVITFGKHGTVKLKALGSGVVIQPLQSTVVKAAKPMVRAAAKQQTQT